MEFNDEKAIFVQIAEAIENDIVRGIIDEVERAPSTNELAARYEINPNTAGKSLTLLTNDGILYKKRGVGMFVSPGARAVIIEKRKQRFNNEYLLPMLREARLLGISRDELCRMLDELWQK